MGQGDGDQQGREHTSPSKFCSHHDKIAERKLTPRLQRIKPHILVLLGPPNAHLLLLTYQTEGTPSLVVTSTLPLSPPTPTLRQAEFFTGVISSGNVALVSLWVGVLSCIEMEIEKDKDKDSSKRRRSSAVAPAVSGREQKLVFKEHFNIK